MSAAYFVDHVFPPLPVRQRGGVGAERLRWYLEREPKDVGAVLHIFLRVIGAICAGSPRRPRHTHASGP
jgi:hypothetical protein